MCITRYPASLAVVASCRATVLLPDPSGPATRIRAPRPNASVLGFRCANGSLVIHSSLGLVVRACARFGDFVLPHDVTGLHQLGTVMEDLFGGYMFGMFNRIPVLRSSLDAAVSLLCESASLGPPQAFRLVNSYTFALAEEQPNYHELLASRGLNLPDGRPVVFALNRLRGSRAAFNQVRGPSFFERCLEAGREANLRHFFLGGTESLLEALNQEASTRFPGVIISGTFAPPFRPMTLDEYDHCRDLISESQADVVWVGLGTPKQDFEAQRIHQDLGVTTDGVGAAFDFLAGTKREAPTWLRAVGLEWAFRLLTEPKRLWRRYLVGNSRFLALILREFRTRAL